jgi:hypothetical protein
MTASRAYCGFVILVGFSAPAGADEQPDFGTDDGILAAQWFTGPLLAPSPPPPAHDRFAIEPYLMMSRGAGGFDGDGAFAARPGGSDRLIELTVFKYGLTDNLALQLLPGFARAQDGTSGFTDLPVQLEYRWFGRTDTGFWHPSLTTTLSVIVPVGPYQNLRHAEDGFGTGAYRASGQLLLQSLFTTFGYAHRMRAWATWAAPLESVGVTGISAYGTAAGYSGTALPGASTELGIADEFGLDQRWALALDVVQDFAGPPHLSGLPPGPGSSSFVLAPAIEYNFADWIGMIVGVQFTAAGHNTSAPLVPQVAVNMFF